MKQIKFLFMAAAAFVGFASAYATTKRTVFTYVQIANNQYYKLVFTTYDASKCKKAATLTCAFTVGVDLGAGPVTKNTLTANGANIKNASHRLYVVL